MLCQLHALEQKHTDTKWHHCSRWTMRLSIDVGIWEGRYIIQQGVPRRGSGGMVWGRCIYAYMETSGKHGAKLKHLGIGAGGYDLL